MASPSRLRFLVTLTTLAAALCGPPGARGQTTTTTMPPIRHVVLLVADDLGSPALPFVHMTPPVEWEKPDDPPDEQDERAVGEATLQRPELNRLAARLFADRTTGGLGVARPGAPDEAASRVVPIDLNVVSPATSTTLPFTYVVPPSGQGCAADTRDNPACQPVTDVLRGFGGLHDLAANGVVFSRFTAASAVCSPTRAALFTGRHIARVKVFENKTNPLKPTEVTIAEWLQQGCPNRPCYLAGGCAGRPCFATGLYGKWDLGDMSRYGEAPWQQGFDEVVDFKGTDRPSYFSKRTLYCSPVTVCAGTFDPCASDLDCAPGVRCGGVQMCDNTPTPCTRLLDNCPPSGRCERAGRYFGPPGPAATIVGPAPGTAVCAPGSPPDSPYCCTPRGNLFVPSDSFRFPSSASAAWVKDGDDNRWYCSNDDEILPTTPKRCLYYTRLLRDQAVNFIRRHRTDEHFLLVVGFTAPHGPLGAPERTLRHYTTAGKVPQDPKVYWPMLEELDAAVGRIVAALDEPCAGCPSPPCPSCPLLSPQTLVLFTSDQGSPIVGYGNPALRGGKQTVYEGGVRVPLIVRGPGVVSGQVPGVPGQILGVASQVDIFATLAEAAGYEVNATGRLATPRAVCSSSSKPCCAAVVDGTCDNGTCSMSPKRCEPCLAPATCGDRWLDGRSLLATLRGGMVAEERRGPRDFVFARMEQTENGGVIVASRKGHAGRKVCRYFWEHHYSTPPDPAPDPLRPIARTVRAASCTPCTGGENDPTCTGLGTGGCQVLGRVCVSGQAEEDACEAGQPPCQNTDPVTGAGIGKLPRCAGDDDCPQQGQRCKPARTKCASCVDAAWKLRSPDESGPLTVTELFDVESNPEEEIGMTGPPLLNCIGSPSLAGVQQDLTSRLQDWRDKTFDDLPYPDE